jgi:hypothetical protein
MIMDENGSSSSVTTVADEYAHRLTGTRRAVADRVNPAITKSRMAAQGHLPSPSNSTRNGYSA